MCRYTGPESKSTDRGKGGVADSGRILPMRRSPLTTLLALAALLVSAVVWSAPSSQARAARSVWPSTGQAAYAFGANHVSASPNEHVAPIASMAKVMTALLVLRAAPLHAGADGFRMRISHRDVRDWHKRVARDESTVPVAYGEHLTERQALAAMLLPSANNIAIKLARHVAGSVQRFAHRMNKAAAKIGMRHTTYTDPSGFDRHTRSTPHDQVLLARIAIKRPTLRHLVARKHYRIPVAGRITNTDTLLGSDGFVGIKTGSMDASGGCLMFLSHRRVHGHRVDLFGVVMGQRGSDLVQAGLQAARRLADRVAPHAA
jgi:D-alanyl-D-alanine carboxypeptidase (penicillin-binding protein 5/6)